MTPWVNPGDSPSMSIEFHAFDPLEAWQMALDIQIGHPVFCIVIQPSDL